MLFGIAIDLEILFVKDQIAHSTPFFLHKEFVGFKREKERARQAANLFPPHKRKTAPVTD